MKIVITGANGFVGSNLVPVLLKKGYEIFEITIDPKRSKALYGDTIIQYSYKPDKQDEMAQAIKDFGPDYCIHLASYLTSADDYATMEKLINANIIFHSVLLDALKGSGIKAFINTGSFSEFRQGNGELDPGYLYAATKTAARYLLKYYSNVYNFKNITITPYTIYGGKDTQKKIIDIIYESLNAETSLDLSPGEQILDFIHLDDIVDFFIETLDQIDKIPSNTNFHLGNGNGHSLKDLALFIENESNKKTNINWGGKDYRPSDIMYAVANISKQFHLLGWKPKISLEYGVKLFILGKGK